jgi:exodeoxyribonuclease VII large subunit
MYNFATRKQRTTLHKTPAPVNESVTLSEIQQRIKQALEASLPQSYWITAEINELKTNPAGHCYLELVDRDAGTLKAKASAAIWASSYRLLKPFFETTTGQPLTAGMRILVKAAVQYHPLYGLNLSITDIDPAYTVGELEIQRRKTIARLQADGIFDMNRRLPFPRLPQRLAVISSEQAAGYRDFMQQLHQNEQGYAFYTQLFPSPVQGAGAVQGIIESLARINDRRGAFDAVVIIRGGGSSADLLCFDDYDLSSHVAQFPLPVLTGIGHDKDQSIVDLVAGRSFKTPTAVAGFLVECIAKEHALLQAWEQRLKNTVQQNLQSAKNRLATMTGRQETAVRLRFQKAHDYLDLLSNTIRHKDPQTILARGYAIVSLNGKTLYDAATVNPDDTLNITLSKGSLRAKAQPRNPRETP